jgi:hypothetical protein
MTILLSKGQKTHEPPERSPVRIGDEIPRLP